MSSVIRILLVLALIGIPVAGAEEPANADRDAHRLKMKLVAETFEISATENDPPTKCVAEPLLRYADPTRRLHESALWLWGAKGRPVAVMATEYYPKQPKGTPWLFEIVSLSDQRIRAQHTAELNWRADQPGVSFKDVPEAGVPADQPTRRLSQMKQLLRRFAAHETAVIEGRVELRPLANPLHRYEDPRAQLVDGAIFAFANGTNPEVFVLLEAHAPPNSPRVWRYSLAQMTGGALSVSIDGKDVWSCTEADPPAVRGSYVNGWLKSE